MQARSHQQVGEHLAAACADSAQPRTQQAHALWRQREARLAQRELDLATGLTHDERARFEPFGVTAGQWMVPEIRAVARMTRESKTLEEAIQTLQLEHRVSTELLAWQIYNSGVRVTLSKKENILLGQWKASGANP